MGNSMLQAWRDNQLVGRSIIAVPSREAIKWTPPDAASLKMNTDAGWLGENGTGLGLIIRNHAGEVQVAATSYINGHMDPLVVEVVAMRWAIQLAVDLEIHSLIVEIDCQALFATLVGSHSYLSISNLVADCHQLMSMFSAISFSFTLREANVVAHKLAANACVFLNRIWWTEVPPCIALDVASDLISI
ncbi:Ribonuclease H-like superfamily [Sesbania bispinosa]|nr:Ribonuclease H-like superfamily [Sesbania bispinosa]